MNVTTTRAAFSSMVGWRTVPVSPPLQLKLEVTLGGVRSSNALVTSSADLIDQTAVSGGPADDDGGWVGFDIVAVASA